MKKKKKDEKGGMVFVGCGTLWGHALHNCTLTNIEMLKECVQRMD